MERHAPFARGRRRQAGAAARARGAAAQAAGAARPRRAARPRLRHGNLLLDVRDALPVLAPGGRRRQRAGCWPTRAPKPRRRRQSRGRARTLDATAAVRAGVRRRAALLRHAQPPPRRRRRSRARSPRRGGAAPRRPAGLRRHQPASASRRWWRGSSDFRGRRLADAHRRADFDQATAHRDRRRHARPRRAPPVAHTMAERCFGETAVADALAAAGLGDRAREAWAPFPIGVPGKTWWAARRR